MSTAREITMKMAMAKAAHDERIVRGLLGRWVSEFEPSIAMRGGEVIGLCVAGDPSGSIPVRVMDARPIVQEIMRLAGIPTDIPAVSFGHDLGFD